MLCIIFMAMSIIKVKDQNVNDDSNMREEVNFKFE